MFRCPGELEPPESRQEERPGPNLPSRHLKLVATRWPFLYRRPDRGTEIETEGARATVYLITAAAICPYLLVAVTT